ncbi:unnamed protein product [Colias eurytheme]|nr:unnamed protein product [Colias eurytheme]
MFKLSILLFLSIAWAADALIRKTAEDGAYPYQASLQRITAPAFYFCSGTIISTEWILTAAFCFDSSRSSSKEIAVGVGSINLSRATLYPVEKIIIHENFNETSLDNNIALVKLASELILNSNVAPIDLASMDTPPGTNCTLTGWGSYSSNPRNRDDLQVAYLDTISLDQCRKEKGGYTYFSITERQLCGERNEQRGVCQVEAGGPLAANDEVVGIISCALLDRFRGNIHPYIFTNVYAYLDWISDNMKN